MGSVGSNIQVSVFLNLLIFFSSLTIFTSKKLSILRDKNIKISKIKLSINNNYDFNFLNKLLVASIVITFVTFNFWIFFNKKVGLIYFVSDILFIFISRRFYILTMESRTEDFINTLKTDMRISFYILLFILFTTYGIVF